MGEILVTSGCSFSDIEYPESTWPVHIERMYKNKFNEFEHYGRQSHGQDYISRSIICGVDSLLKKHNSEDISVIVCWSGMRRHSVLFNHESKKLNYKFKDYNADDLGPAPHRMLMLPIGVWENFGWELHKIFPLEQSIIMNLENILRTQHYLELKKIKYKFFTFNDIFSIDSSFCFELNDSDKTRHKIRKSEREKFEGQRLDKYFPNSSYLFEMIDWSKWWFHNDYGGLTEWIQDNIENGFDDEKHPLEKSQKLFTEKVIKKWIKQL